MFASVSVSRAAFAISIQCNTVRTNEEKQCQSHVSIRILIISSHSNRWFVVFNLPPSLAGFDMIIWSTTFNTGRAASTAKRNACTELGSQNITDVIIHQDTTASIITGWFHPIHEPSMSTPAVLTSMSIRMGGTHSNQPIHGKHHDRHSLPIAWGVNSRVLVGKGTDRVLAGPIQDMHRHNYEFELPNPSQQPRYHSLWAIIFGETLLFPYNTAEAWEWCHDIGDYDRSGDI